MKLKISHLEHAIIGIFLSILATSCFSDRELPSPPDDLEERNAAFLRLEADLKLLEKMNAEEASVALLHEDHRVRARAARHMGTLRNSSKHFLNELTAALKDKEQTVRLEAAISLGSIGDERAIEPLILTLVDENPRIRLWVWKSLRTFGTSAITALLPYMGEASPTKDLSFRDEAGGKRFLRKEIASRFPTLGKRAIPYLIEALDSEDAWIMRNAISILGEMKKAAKNSLPRLAEILETTDSNSDKIRVIKAFAKIGDLHPVVMPALQAASKHKNKKVAKEAKRVIRDFSKNSKDKKSETAKKRMNELKSRKQEKPKVQKPEKPDNSKL